jgi:opacity protein-like surface antigen
MMKKYLTTSILFLMVLFFAANAWALGRFAIGPEAGFLYQTNKDPTDSSLQGAPGFGVGVSGVYEFDRELSGIAIDYAISVFHTSTLCYRNVSIEGATGTYRETVTAFNWLFGGRYYFGRDKWRPYAGLGVGFQYMRRSSTSYRDQFDQPLPNPPVQSHFNMAIVPQAGIEYRPTFRWAIGLGVRALLAIRSSGIVPGVFVPLSVHVAF